MKKSVF